MFEAIATSLIVLETQLIQWKSNRYDDSMVIDRGAMVEIEESILLTRPTVNIAVNKIDI